MKNLKNYTKAELISKLNNVKQNNNNNNKDSIFTIFMTFLLMVKSFLLKITLIALIIKIFRRYKIFRKIFTILNTILFSIFGFSLIDIYEIESLSKFFNNIIDILSKFHNSILDLFGRKVDKIDLPTKNESMRTIQQGTTGIQASNESNNKIIERFTKIIHGEEVKSEIQEENPYYKNKYVIIAGLLILSGLAWYFSDEIRPVGTTILAWINLMRSRRDDDSGDKDPNIQVNSRWNLNKLTELKDSVKRKVYGENKKEEVVSSPESIKLNDERVKGKTIDLSNLSQEELDRRGLNEINFSHITGDNTKFITEANQVLKEIKVFNDLIDEAPLTTNGQILYESLKDRLNTLAAKNSILYEDIIMNDTLNERIEKFWDLENEFNLFKSPSSETYQEAEIAANQEKDVWSDRGNSPQVLSPQLVAETAMETIGKDKPKLIIESIDETKKVEDNPVSSVELKTFWDGLIDGSKRIFNKDNTNNSTVKQEDNEITLEILSDRLNTKIESSKNSTPEDMKDYFHKEEISENEKFTEKVEDSNIEILTIKSEDAKKLLDNYNHIIDDGDSFSEDISKIFESLDPTLFDNEPVKVIETDDSLQLDTNLVLVSQRTEGIFSQENSNKNEKQLSKENEKLYSKDNIDQNVKDRPNISETLKAIRSKRLEYGSPSVANVGLPRGDLSPLIINQASTSKLPDINEGIDLEDNNQVNDNRDSDNDSITLHDWKKEIKLDIKKGNPYERFIEFDFGEHHKDINRMYIITNDGQSFHVNPHTVNKSKQDIKWDIKGKANTYWRDLDIYSITIFDDKGTQTIYENKNIKFLDNFNDNIGKGFR